VLGTYERIMRRVSRREQVCAGKKSVFFVRQPCIHYTFVDIYFSGFTFFIDQYSFDFDERSNKYMYCPFNIISRILIGVLEGIGCII